MLDLERFVSGSHFDTYYICEFYFLILFYFNYTPHTLFQVILTPTHLAIVMEYASGGELYERISNAGRFNEDEVLICSCMFVLLNQCGI